MRNPRVIKLLQDELSAGSVVTDTHALTPFETDGLTAIRQTLRATLVVAVAWEAPD